jgi:hypothetical protein
MGPAVFVCAEVPLEHADFSVAYIVEGCTDDQLLLLYQIG